MIVALARRRGMADLDPSAILPPSRDELSNETDLLLGHIQQLGQDFFNSDTNSVDQALLSSWNTFVSQVNSWDAGPRVLAHVVDITWRDQLLGYQQQFNGFLQSFAAAGVSTSVAPFTFNAPPSTLSKIATAAEDAAKAGAKPLLDTLSTLEKAAIVGGVALLGFAVYLTYEAGRTVRHVGGDLLR